MAKKKVAVAVPAKPKKPTVKEQLETLRATVREYFNHLRYRAPEYQIVLPGKVIAEGGMKKDHAVNVPSLIASIVTAQGLNKEVRLRAIQNSDGGALEINFYSPVNIDGKADLLS